MSGSLFLGSLQNIMNARRIVASLRPVAMRVPATARSMAGDAGGNKVPPYKYVRGVVEQHTSPFELRQVDTLFANFGHKFKHETIDNIPDLLPAAGILAFIVWYTNWVNAAKEKESRF